MNVITWVFLGLMVGVSMYLWNRRHILPLPNLMLTLGVLGTFVGIFWGLYRFDVHDIQGSIPNLLEGLKFAFVTSILGMIIAIALRIYSLTRFPAGAAEGQDEGGATLETIASLLQADAELRQDYYRHSALQRQQLQRALVDGDGALSTHLREVGDSLLAKQDELLQGFERFSQRVAEQNNQALIESLAQVMREFNTKINVQFGENFRQLNEAVEKLVDWQQQYAGQLEKMIEQFARTQEGVAACQVSIGQIDAYFERIRGGVEVSENAFKTLVERSGTFQRNVEELNRSLMALYNQTSFLSNHLYSFSQFADKAKDAVPLIREQSRKAGERYVRQTANSGK